MGYKLQVGAKCNWVNEKNVEQWKQGHAYKTSHYNFLQVYSTSGASRIKASSWKVVYWCVPSNPSGHWKEGDQHLPSAHALLGTSWEACTPSSALILGHDPSPHTYQNTWSPSLVLTLFIFPSCHYHPPEMFFCFLFRAWLVLGTVSTESFVLSLSC